MQFFDCNMSYGLHNANDEPIMPARSISDIINEIKRSGISKAVIRRDEYSSGSPLAVMDMLIHDIAPFDFLYGIIPIVPTINHEMPGPDVMPKYMKENKIIGFGLYPKNLRFLPKPYVLKDWFEFAIANNIPIFATEADGVSLSDLSGILDRFPQLTVIYTLNNCWPVDRLLRPLYMEYKNLCLDLANKFIEGELEDYSKYCGVEKLLYGSGFPISYTGSNMMMIKHAAISDEEKQKIAFGNMQNLVNNCMRGIFHDK